MVSNRLSRGHGKFSKYDDSPGSTHNLVVGLVQPGSRVLEFGSGTGVISQVLRDRVGATVVGIESDPEAAQAAMAYCERVLIGDVEELDLEADLGTERFDVVHFADVLEHLRDPASLLRRVPPFVAEGGSIIVSIPNVAHASVRMALLAGSFRYREQGLLDETHLRFFTREGLQDLLESSGYVATQWLRRRIEPEETEIPVPSSLPDEVRAWATADPEATTYQFVVRASPAEPAAQLLALRTELAEAREELERLESLESDIDQRARDASEELVALRRAHEILRRRIVAERAAFAEGIAAVQEEVYGSRSWRYTAPVRNTIRRLRRFKT